MSYTEQKTAKLDDGGASPMELDAFKGKDGQKGGKGGQPKGPNPSKDVVCHICQKKGHMMQGCWHAMHNGGSGKPPQPKDKNGGPRHADIILRNVGCDGAKVTTALVKERIEEVGKAEPLSADDASWYRSVSMRLAYQPICLRTGLISRCLLRSYITRSLKNPTSAHLAMLKRGARYLCSFPRLVHVFPYLSVLRAPLDALGGRGSCWEAGGSEGPPLDFASALESQPSRLAAKARL